MNHPAPQPRFMWITPGRILYAGLLGRPSTRRLGGWVVYFADDEPLTLSFGARAGDHAAVAHGLLGVVPPHVPHRVGSAGRMLCDLIVEPEHIDVAAAPAPLGDLLRRGGGAYRDDDAAAAVLHRMLLDARDRLATARPGLPADDAALDRWVFGSALPQPVLDARVRHALQRIEAEFAANALVPGHESSGVELAAQAGLSLSRFVQLFARQVGVPLRTLRGWKRARSVLQHVTQRALLTEIAHDTGYPDSAHFSRSMRQVFGLQPRDVMAGSRRLELLAATPAGPRRRGASQ